MTTKKIETASGYEAALAKAWSLMDAAPGSSPEEEALEALVFSIGEYEQARHPIDPPDSDEAIKFRMGQEAEDPQELMASLIAAAGGAERIGVAVLFGAAETPFGNMIVEANYISVSLHHVSSLLALEIARLVKQEREKPETTLEIGTAEDMPDGYFHADDEIDLTGPIGIGIPITPQADLHVVGRVFLADVLDDNQSSLLARPLLDRFLGKTVEVTVRVLVGGKKGDGVIVDEAAEGFPHGKGERHGD